MWYRLYLTKMSKKEYRRMIKMPYNDFMKKYDKDNEEYVNLSDITKSLHELWKYVDYSKNMKPVVFQDNKLNDMFCESSFNIASKEIIKEVIADYSWFVADYYKSLIDWERKMNFLWMDLWKYKLFRKQKNERIYRHLWNRFSMFSWKRFKNKQWYFWWSKPYSIEKWDIVNSDEYEYQIFELIRIYRNFNDKKDVILYFWR